VRAYWLSDTEGAGKENWFVLERSFCMSLTPRNADFCMSLIPTNSVFCMSLIPEKYTLSTNLVNEYFCMSLFPTNADLFQLRNIMVTINHDYPDNYCRLECNAVCRCL